VIYIKQYKNIETKENISCRRDKILYRIVDNTTKKELKEFPEIDIIITHKRKFGALGRFYVSLERCGAEYRFIGSRNNPCIVLFWEGIRT